ncbi:uncharacterized protein LOC128548566 [Mercenaria mercenaria]|uniref:uncharacterized protein LOC128548566 n=1 Tax=Mercenaria mercenaria TaxID=6596 RepID=UPI00234F2979|nr:uncharacterized protein LOC128548566 [Mercenaria mercenaria]
MAFTCAVNNCSNGGYWLNKWKKQLCTVCGCLHSEKHCKCNPPFRLFSFPTQKRNPEGRLRWKQLVNRINGNKMWSPSKDSRVCSKHFLEGEPTLQNPFPTLHLGYDGFESKVKRIMFFRDESDSSCKVTYMTVDDPQYTTSPYHPDPPVEMLSLKVEFPWQLTLLAVINVLLQTLAIVNKQLQSVKSENTRLKQEIALLKRKRYVDSILKSDEDVNYFTGLPSKSVFEKFHKVIAPLVNRRWLGVKGGLQHVRKFANEPSRFGPERKLSSRAEFLLTLMRLRLGLLGKDLAVRFDISESLCGRIFLAWLRACSKVLVQWCIFQMRRL